MKTLADHQLTNGAMFWLGWLAGLDKSCAIEEVDRLALDELVRKGLAHLSASGARADLTEIGRQLVSNYFTERYGHALR